jgi:hypothetical protein
MVLSVAMLALAENEEETEGACGGRKREREKE